VDGAHERECNACALSNLVSKQDYLRNYMSTICELPIFDPHLEIGVMATMKQTYKPLDSEEDRATDYDDLQDHRPRKTRWPNPSTIVLSITTAIFGFYSIYLSLQANCACLDKGAVEFSAGYSTEWGTKSPLVHCPEANFNVDPARSSIELSRVKFKGAFRYNETSKTYYREHDLATPQYIGPPSPEIDHA